MTKITTLLAATLTVLASSAYAGPAKLAGTVTDTFGSRFL